MERVPRFWKNRRSLLPIPESVVILLVDSADDAFLVKQALQKAGLRNHVITINESVLVFPYFEGTGEYQDRRNFPMADLVLLDLKLPKVDGFEILRWIRQQPRLKDLPVIVLTSLDALPNIRKAYEFGADSFMAKPGDFENLDPLLNTLALVWRKASLKGRSQAGAT